MHVLLLISYITKMKSNGLRALPCLKPMFTWNSFDIPNPTTTLALVFSYMASTIYVRTVVCSCIQLYSVVCCCMQLYAVVCCCVLLCAVVFCCVLLYAVVCCCVLLCAVVCCCIQY